MLIWSSLPMEDPYGAYPSLSRQQVALFERNPVCALCYRLCMDMCEEYGGINFELLDSIVLADNLCEQILQEPWNLNGVEYYSDWVRNRLGNSQPAIVCTFATTCVTLSCMEGLPEPVYQLAHDLRGLITGAGNDLYYNLSSAAYRQDITLAADSYGVPPPKPDTLIQIEQLKQTNAQLIHQVSTLKNQLKMKDQPSSEAKTIINVQGDYIAEQNNNIHDCTIYASGITPQSSSQQTEEVASAEKGDKDTPGNAYPFIVYSKLAELGTYTVEEFEAAYRKAAKQGAPKLAKFLKHYNGLGVLDFDDNDKKQIFEILKAFFPSEIKYGYTNFTIYF